MADENAGNEGGDKKESLSAEELALLPDADLGDEGGDQDNPPPGDGKPGDDKGDDKGEVTDEGKGDQKPGDGKQTAEEKTAQEDNWREEMAKHFAAGDDKAYKREMKRLERITDRKSLYGMYRELENKVTGGGLVKIPKADSSDEEKAEFNKAMGVPPTPAEYFDHIKLDNDAVIGDADRPIAETFAQAIHPAGATPQVMNAAMNWYFQHQEQQAADLDQADDDFDRESTKELKDEWGATFQRKINAIAPLFAGAPGGSDSKNPDAVISRLLAGRTSDGQIIGNDPDMTRLLVGWAQEINPSATIVEDGDQTGVSAQKELDDIRKYAKENKREYFKNDAMQARELELIDAVQKHQSRG